jgi:hypothetical protein
LTGDTQSLWSITLSEIEDSKSENNDDTVVNRNVNDLKAFWL